MPEHTSPSAAPDPNSNSHISRLPQQRHHQSGFSLAIHKPTFLSREFSQETNEHLREPTHGRNVLLAILSRVGITYLKPMVLNKSEISRNILPRITTFPNCKVHEHYRERSLKGNPRVGVLRTQQNACMGGKEIISRLVQYQTQYSH